MPDATDSAGIPWAGRHFEPSASSDDDGSAPEALVAAIHAFLNGEGGEADVVDALRDARLLIPLVAELGEEGQSDAGLKLDKTQELSIVTVEGPDGRTVLPAFSSVEAMKHWQASARPIPLPAVRFALAAVSEHTDLIVLDATTDAEFAIRRPAVWALAQKQPWTPSYRDPEIFTAFVDAASPEPSVLSVHLTAGDPRARLAGPELIVHLSLASGLDQPALDALLARLQVRWAHSELIAARVDSLGVKLS
ncbi:MAG: SseB family protein [Salinibacterium sp.]|nr:MAG: SseB family protein [Salinibacterium sp.]